MTWTLLSAVVAVGVLTGTGWVLHTVRVAPAAAEALPVGAALPEVARTPAPAEVPGDLAGLRAHVARLEAAREHASCEAEALLAKTPPDDPRHADALAVLVTLAPERAAEHVAQRVAVRPPSAAAVLAAPLRWATVPRAAVAVFAEALGPRLTTEQRRPFVLALAAMRPSLRIADPAARAADARRLLAVLEGGRLTEGFDERTMEHRVRPDLERLRAQVERLERP